MTTKAPLVVIVGGGFGGLAAAKGLKRSPVDVLLIDRSNHHVFQPLLYQVATSVLAPGQIASPIRSLLADQTNTSVMLGSVTGVDAASKQVIVDVDDKTGISINYDYLILATGATHSDFGHNEFAAFAPGLKSLSDAESLRNHLLEAFEKAEVEDDSDRRKALMTFVMVGAGPTGVEMASAIAVMTQTTQRLPSNRSEIGPYRSRGHGHSAAGHFFGETLRSRKAAVGVAGSRCSSRKARSIHRRGWCSHRRGAHSGQDGSMDGRCCPFTCREMAWMHCRPGGPRSHSAGPFRPRSSGHLCGWGHSIARSGWQAPPGGCAGCDAAGQVRSQVHLPQGDWPSPVAAVSLLR
jgi:hypothetical protein